MQYLFLLSAIFFEIIATTLLEYSKGFTVVLPTVESLMCYLLSLFLLSKALVKINLGVAYALWSGIGIVATTILGVVLLKQGVSPRGIAGIFLILAGCLILNLYG